VGIEYENTSGGEVENFSSTFGVFGEKSRDIAGCTVMTESGTYELTEDITDDTADACLTVTASNVSIDGNGHTVDGVNRTPGSVGVLAEDVKNVTLGNTNITGWDSGVEYRNVSKGGVMDNNISENSGGVLFFDSSRNTVGNNTVAHNDRFYGIYLNSSLNNDILDNTALKNGASGQGEVIGSGGGIGLDDWSSANTVVGNELRSNYKGGISVLRSSNRNDINSNTVNGSTLSDGVVVFGSTLNNISNNEVRMNQIGVLLTAGANKNVVQENTVIDNEIDGIQSIESNNNSVIGNTVAGDGSRGIVVSGGKDMGVPAEKITVEQNTVVGSKVRGIELDGVRSSTVANNSLRDNGNGIVLTDAFSNDSSVNNQLLNNTALNNTDWAVIVEQDSNVTVEGLDIGESISPNTKLSFEGKEVKLGSNTTPPVNPEDSTSIGRFFEAENLTRSGVLGIELQYSQQDLESAGVSESELGLLRYNGTGWVTVPSTVDKTKETISASITEFSAFGAFSREKEPANFSVDIKGTNSPAVEGAKLDVEVNVTNLGDLEAEQEVTLTGLSGETRDSTNVTLSKGNSKELTLSWDTEVGQNGTGEVAVSTDNGTETTGVSVIQKPETAFFDMDIQGSNSPVVEGEKLLVGVNVTNYGKKEGTQEVTLTDTEGTKQDNFTVTLKAGERTQRTLTWETDRGDATTGEVTVSSDDDQDAETVSVVETAFFDVGIVGTNEPTVEGEQLKVNATVTNTGGVKDTQEIELKELNVAENTVSETNNLRLDGQTVSLNPGESSNVTLIWDTEVGDSGSQGVVVRSENTSRTTVVRIQKATEEFSIEVFGTNEPVIEGEELGVTATVTNNGGAQGTQDVSLSDFGGLQRDSVEVILGVGDTKRVNLTWKTIRGDNGTGDVSVSTENETATERVSIKEAPDPADFGVEIDSVEEPVTEGERATVEAVVENRGNSTGRQGINLFDFDGEVVDTVTVELTPGGSQTVELGWLTERGDRGIHELKVESEDDSDSIYTTVQQTGFKDILPDFFVTPIPPTVDDDVRLRSSPRNPDSLEVLERRWSINETGEKLTGRVVQPKTTEQGNYTVTHTVVDELGRISKTTETIRVRGTSDRMEMSPTSPERGESDKTVTVNETLIAEMPEMDIDERLENRFSEVRVSVRREQNVSVSVRRSEETLRDTPEPEDRDSLGYIDINHTFEDDAVERTGFSFEVSKDRLRRDFISPEDVVLQRYNDQTQEWETYAAEIAEERPETYGYWAEASGMSVFSVSAPSGSTGSGGGSGSGSSGFGGGGGRGGTLFAFDSPSTFSLSDLSSSAVEVGIGESVEFSGTVELVEGFSGNTDLDLTIGNENVDTKTLDVTRGNPAGFSFEHVFDEPGEYDVYIRDKLVESIVVRGQEGDGEGESEDVKQEETETDQMGEGTDGEEEGETEQGDGEGARPAEIQDRAAEG